MSQNTTNQTDDQEIDLGLLIKKVNGFFGNISLVIFKGLLFLKRKSLILISLFVIGVAAGYFLDRTNNTYDSEIIVSPNLGGTDYLYSKIDLLASKLKEKDVAFFKSIGVKNPKQITLIEIEPIIDIYSFVNNNTAIAANAENTQNFELMKLLAEDSDIEKVMKDKITSKNYPHHKIHIETNSKISNKELIQPILKFLNTDKYLNEILTISKENIKIKMKKNEELITQMDSLIKILTINLSKNQKNSNLVYNNENNQFNALFDLKNSLINEIGSQRIALVNSNLVIKDISTVVNVKNTKTLNDKLKFILPIVLIMMFIFYSLFLSFYRRQAKKLTLSKQ
jgi:hypothetical protein